MHFEAMKAPLGPKRIINTQLGVDSYKGFSQILGGLIVDQGELQEGINYI